MTPLPKYRPKQLSLGHLESEILNIIWDSTRLGATDIHDRILSDPDRELAYASVSTILNRLTQKGWLTCNKQERSYLWQARISATEAQALTAYEHLNQFLAVGNPDVVAAFADDLDRASMAQLEAIAHKLQAIRQAKEER